jgi:hypothetical protein
MGKKSKKKRKYISFNFLEDCSILANAKAEVNNWGLTAEGVETKKVLYAGKEGTDGAVVARNKDGKVVICWACGLNHFKEDCKSHKCSKCKAFLIGKGGVRIKHDAQTCLKKGKSGDSKGSSAGGGDKKGFTGKRKEGGWTPGKDKVKAPFLPMPNSLDKKTLKSYHAALTKELEGGDSEEDEPSAKKKRPKKTEREPWGAEESD